MHYRPFGNTHFKVSEIGLGCWQLGGADWGDVPDDDALAILRAAAEAGVNFLDTADVYGNGRSETLIGRFLREHRGGRQIYVATKLGRFPEPGGRRTSRPRPSAGTPRRRWRGWGSRRWT